MSSLIVLLILSIRGSLGQSWGAKNLNLSIAGCADGSREWFADVTKFPYIAGCSGCFSNPGVRVTTSQVNTAVTCNRQAGNEPGFSNNCAGCSISDLCASGWHLSTYVYLLVKRIKLTLKPLP